MTRVLGVDLGTVRVGLAVSDPDGILAQPFEVIPRDGAEVEIAFRAGRLEVGEIMVGIPYNLDGTPGHAAEVAEAFAEVLEEKTGLPVARWDERLSSKQAARAMREGGKSAKQQRGELDKVAAALVLQSYLDSKRTVDES
jgi:putative holliday junction resolvase